MITQRFKLNMIPSGVGVVVNVSQYDKLSRTIEMELLNGSVSYEIPSGSLVEVRGTKKDKTGFIYPCTFTDNVVSFDIEQQMTIFEGVVPCEIRITNNGNIIGSANFTIKVEITPLSDDTVISETDLPLLEEAIEKADEILTNNYVKTVNNTSPDTSGNVNVITGCLVVEISSFSSLPQTITNSNINSNLVLINSVLSDPSAQTSDWTITTSDGSLTISGSISGSTTATLYFIEQRGV